MFSGSIVALVTPMHSNGDIDYDGLAQLISFHRNSGTKGLVIAGTTGESATLTRSEHIALIERACELSKDLPVIAGTGSNSTAQTLDLSRTVDDLPISGFLVVTPYYNKPTQEGMYRHFSTIAEGVNKPVTLYNVPSRTGVDLKPETVIRLSEHGNIIGVKEATGELARVQPLREGCHADFCLLSGDDGTSCEFILSGGDGVISVTANVAASQMQRLCNFACSGDREGAMKIDGLLQELHQVLFVESNPIPVKWALSQMGLISNGIRLPLTTLVSTYHEAMLAAMKKAGITW